MFGIFHSSYRFRYLGPQTSLAIISSVAQFAPEPPRLDRYRNELAANLLGIPPAKADSEGLLILQQLSAIAPNPDTDIVFFSQQRAVNVVKTCQQWITSDEDIGEPVESAMTAIFVHLAPILQNVPGSHWDLIFDVVENNLEVKNPALLTRALSPILYLFRIALSLMTLLGRCSHERFD